MFSEFIVSLAELVFGVKTGAVTGLKELVLVSVELIEPKSLNVASLEVLPVFACPGPKFKVVVDSPPFRLLLIAEAIVAVSVAGDFSVLPFGIEGTNVGMWSKEGDKEANFVDNGVGLNAGESKLNFLFIIGEELVPFTADDVLLLAESVLSFVGKE